MGLGQTLSKPEDQIRTQAREFVRILKSVSEHEAAKHADDLLTFLHSLQDRYRIRSTAKAKAEAPTGSLTDIIYLLESRPGDLVRDGDMKRTVIRLLEGILRGEVEILARKG